MTIQDPELAEYADRLEAAGFVVFEPASGHGRYFRYSRVVDGRECFGFVQRCLPSQATRFMHTMPIPPSLDYGSSMTVKGADGLTVEAAKLIARPSNRNDLVGWQRNHDDQRFTHLYVARVGCSSVEQGPAS